MYNKILYDIWEECRSQLMAVKTQPTLYDLHFLWLSILIYYTVVAFGYYIAYLYYWHY